MQRYLDAISLAALTALLGFTGFALYGPVRLPNQIPTHFDQLGHADAWTTVSSLETLPFIAVIVYVLLSVVTAFSWLARDAAQKNPDGVPGLETLFLKLIKWVKAESIGVFAFIQISSIQALRRQELASSWLGWWILLTVLLVTIVWYVVEMSRAENLEGRTLVDPEKPVNGV
jgi:uncharacterized membrane protein